jgi:tetratricopeptide (TPR) repeat protein
MLTNYKQINEKYALNYEEKEFTPFEKNIFNSTTKINPSNFDQTNVEILNSLINYYYIQSILANYNENIKLYIQFCEKLSKFGDSRGYHKIGNFHYEEKDFEKSIDYYKISSDMGNLYSKLNLSMIYDNLKINPEAKFQLLNEAIELNNIPAIFLIAKYYLSNGDQNNCIKYLELGISKECKKCLEVMQAMIRDTKMFYKYLMELQFTNNMVQQKIRDINSRINQEEIDNCRGQKLLFLLDNGDIIKSGNRDVILNVGKNGNL